MRQYTGAGGIVQSVAPSQVFPNANIIERQLFKAKSNRLQQQYASAGFEDAEPTMAAFNRTSYRSSQE